jgi:hypothetical protein
MTKYLIFMLLKVEFYLFNYLKYLEVIIPKYEIQIYINYQ